MSARQVALPGDEGLPRAERVRRRADYQRCYREGRRLYGALAILYYTPNHLPHPRLGITASRRVGSSVVRHRLRRRTKEIYRRWEARRELPAVDLVVHWKPEAREADFWTLRHDLVRLFSRLLREGERGERRGSRSRRARRGRRVATGAFGSSAKGARER